jgi:hypothetical protein
MTFLTTKKETVKPGAPLVNQPKASKPAEENEDLPF